MTGASIHLDKIAHASHPKMVWVDSFLEKRIPAKKYAIKRSTSENIELNHSTFKSVAILAQISRKPQAVIALCRLYCTRLMFQGRLIESVAKDYYTN